MTQTVINLTRGMPPVEAFPTEELIHSAEAALRNDANVLLQYGRSPGYKPLREWLGRVYGVGADQVMIGNSSLELLAFLAQTQLGPGKRAFVEAPSYDRAITIFRRSGAEVVGIPLREDGLDLDVLEAEIRRGRPALLYLIPDFQNPMGITTSLAKRQQLAELACSYEFWVVEDSPYRALRYMGQEVPTLYSLAPDRVLHMSSFSKTLAPGLRLGYLIGPADKVSELAAWAVDTYIGPVFPTQGMVYEYCRAGLLERNLARLKALYAPRLQATLDALARYLPRATWTQPEGGYYVGVTLPAGVHMADLLPRAAAVGLQLSDGRGFFPNPSDGDRFLRIPFCSVTPAELDTGMARLAQIV